MSNPIFLKDNNNSKDTVSPEVALQLDCIANKNIAELKQLHENLIVYQSCSNDKIDREKIFNLYHDCSLETYNLVGFIGVNNVKINIGSRFSEDNGNQYFIQYMLQKIYKLNLFDFNTTHDNTNIWEQLLYLILPIFLKKAFTQGVYKKYQKKHYNDANLKGKIEIPRHINKNLPFIGNIAYSNRELSFNNPVNQLIRHTIEFVTSKGFSSIFYNDYFLNNAVQTIKTITPDYNLRDRQKLILINHKKVNHPFFTEYEPLRKLCIQILNYDGLSFSNNKNKVYGLLIDAAWLWEEYLNTILSDLNFIHPENKTGYRAMKLFAKSRDIYPDFYNTNISVVVDAKYKNIENKEMSREDVYQVISYMYRLKAKYGVLLFPSKSSNSLVKINMHEDSYGSKEALFIKCGMKIPEETESYIDYINCFKDNEIELKNYFKIEWFKKEIA